MYAGGVLVTIRVSSIRVVVGVEVFNHCERLTDARLCRILSQYSKCEFSTLVIQEVVDDLRTTIPHVVGKGYLRYVDGHVFEFGRITGVRLTPLVRPAEILPIKVLFGGCYIGHLRIPTDDIVKFLINLVHILLTIAHCYFPFIDLFHAG